MDFSKIRVLVIDSAGKQPYAMVRGLKEIGCHVTVLCRSKLDPCYVSNKPDERILNTKIEQFDDDYFHYLLSLVSTGKYDVMMPVGEMSTNFVTSHEAEFVKYLKLACAPRNVYIKAFNKQQTFEKAIELGIPCPYTRRNGQSVEDYLKNATFPVIIKPRQGMGSIGFHKFSTKQELIDALSKNSFNPDEYVIQEFVTFNHRICVDMFIDKKGNVCTSIGIDVLRWFPIDAGSAVVTQAIDAPDLIDYTKRLLLGLGWQGYADVGFMIDSKTGEPRLLEINGRIPAGVKLAYTLGCNISRQFIEMIYDEEVTKYPDNRNFNQYLRYLDTDIAWFFNSPNRFRAKPSWFCWKNTVEVLYTKDDRLPFFSQFLQKLLDYRNIIKRKKH